MARKKGIRYPKGYPKPVKRLYPNGWPGNLRAVLYLNNREVQTDFEKSKGLIPNSYLTTQSEMSDYG